MRLNRMYFMWILGFIFLLKSLEFYMNPETVQIALFSPTVHMVVWIILGVLSLAVSATFMLSTYMLMTLSFVVVIRIIEHFMTMPIGSNFIITPLLFQCNLLLIIFLTSMMPSNGAYVTLSKQNDKDKVAYKRNQEVQKKRLTVFDLQFKKRGTK